MQMPGCSVVTVGDTGAGKSTLLNAMLGETSVLPTNGESIVHLHPNSHPRNVFLSAQRPTLWQHLPANFVPETIFQLFGWKWCFFAICKNRKSLGGGECG